MRLLASRFICPTTCPTPAGAKYKILAGTAAAGSYAEQLVELEAYRVENNFCDGVKGLHVYGAKVVQPTGLVVATASKTASTTGAAGTCAKAVTG